MEFRLNKVDPEVRYKVNEATSSGKIHTKSGIVINKDSKKDNETEFEDELKKQKKKEKKKIVVEAVKVEDMQIPAYKEADKSSEDETRGHFLDVRK